MRTADVFHAPAVPYNTPIRGRLSTPFTVLFSETRNTLPAQIDTNTSTIDLCWVGIGETKNSMKIETRIKVWVERNKKHGYARIGILGLGHMGTWEYYFIMSAILNSKSPKPQHFTNSFVKIRVHSCF
jgi:hypothetical protein